MSKNNITFSINNQNLTLKRSGFPSQKAHTAFIKLCVRMTRTTIEYKEWSAYVKDVLGFKTCEFTNETSDEITVEIHHHPLTLYDIVDIVLSTYLTNEIEFCTLDIIKDVLILHYNNNVGYVPIVASLHEKYHNGFLIIPPKFIHGVWDYLLKTDGYCVSEDIENKANELMSSDKNQYDIYHQWQNIAGDKNG